MSLSEAGSDHLQLAIKYTRKAGAYLVSVMTIISGIGYMGVYTPIGGIALIIAGLILLPEIQTLIESHTDMEMTTITILGAYGLLFIIGAALGLNQVDMSQAPEFVSGV